MPKAVFAKSIARRSALAALGSGVVASLMRPLGATVVGPPRRLLVIHRPCGSVPEQFFLDAMTTSLAGSPLPAITSPLEPLKQDVVLLRGVTCPRDIEQLGDAHVAGLIAMMTGRRPIIIPGTDSAGDPNAKNIVADGPSIDQYLAGAVLQSKTPLASLQTTANEPSTAGLPGPRVMSYAGSNQPLYPKADDAKVFETVFGVPLDGANGRRLDDQAVLDCVNEDLERVYGLVPSAQKPKLDAHIAAIRALRDQLEASDCQPPELAPLPGQTDVLTRNEAAHLTLARNQLAIIRSAFQCDLTRVATFTFAHVHSDLRFHNMTTGVMSGDGHHSITHNTSNESDKVRIEQVYCELLAELLQSMKAVSEGSGTLLDNTLVVYLNEHSAHAHQTVNMPLVLAGAKNWGLQTGQQLDCGGKYMNDVWAAVCASLGLAPTFGAPEFSTSPVTGLFA